MNSYIDAQCKNMIAMVSTFQQACTIAARQDDGKTSKDEEKLLKKIAASADKFKADLQRLSSK